MILQFYIKPNTIGLCFANQADRDRLWDLLGGNQNCAERFGERTIRFNSAKATDSFNIPMQVDPLLVFSDKPIEVKPKPELRLSDLKTVPLPEEPRVIPTAPTPIDPVAIIPSETAYVETNKALVPPLRVEFPTPPQPPPAMIEMPQVSSVTEIAQAAQATQAAPKPPDLRSRAGREWKAKQQAAAQ